MTALNSRRGGRALANAALAEIRAWLTNAEADALVRITDTMIGTFTVRRARD